VSPGPGEPADETLAEDPETRSLARRLRERRDIIEHRIDSTREHFEGARPDSSLIDTVFRAIEVDTATGGGVLSAAVAFRIFLFLVPYVFFFVVGMGFVSDVTDGDPNSLTHAVGIGGLIAGAVRGAGDLSTTQRITALVVSGLALYLASRAAVKVLRITHGLIWRVPIPKLTKSSRVAAAFIGLVSVQLVVGAAVGWLRSRSVLLGVVGVVVTGLVPFGIWLFVSWRLPRAETPWWALLPGAGVVGVGTVLLHAATVYYFAYEIEAKSETYGAIGASLALLLWAYLLGRIITLSAAVNAAFWFRNEERLGHSVPEALDLEEQFSPAEAEDPER
jgi:uncharacterized BrkB/YihY/UPF0761 family membrane protein